jgi:hypothetical protein
MKRRKWTAIAGLVSAIALISVPSAYAAYASPKLEVRYVPGSVIIKASTAAEDDATAATLIVAPDGTQATTTQAPGTTIGTVQALVIATTSGNIQLPISGSILVAAPGQVPAETIVACLDDVQPNAVWLMALSAAGQSITLPMYLAIEDDVPGIYVCLPHPSQATFGAKLVSAELTFSGVFTQTPGVWLSAWIPYDAAGNLNAAAGVVSPAAFLPGVATIAARRAGNGAIVTGRVAQGALPRAGAAVVIFGGPRANRLRRLGSVRTRANGTFTFRARTGTFFRANATGAAGSSAPLCAVLAPVLAPIPCVNGTINGFTAQSRVIRKR